MLGQLDGQIKKCQPTRFRLSKSSPTWNNLKLACKECLDTLMMKIEKNTCVNKSYTSNLEYIFI